MKNQTWDGKGKGSPAGTRFFMELIRRVGILPAYPFLVFPCSYYTFFDHRSKAGIRSLRNHLGLKTSLVAYFRHFFSFGMSLIDRMAFLLTSQAPFSFEYQNEHLITGTAAGGKGVILLNSHMGNWEIAGSLLVDRIKTPLNAVMLDAERDEMRRIYRSAFDQRRFNTIPVTADGLETSLLSLQCLRRGELLSLAGDRVLDQQSEVLEFLGGPARFARGPFALAALTGASIIPVFTFKTSARHYVFKAYEPITFDTVQRSTRNELIRDKMKEYVAILEGAAREHPYQWYNFFEFWA